VSVNAGQMGRSFQTQRRRGKVLRPAEGNENFPQRPSLFFSARLRKNSGHPASIASAPLYVSASRTDPTASHAGSVNEADRLEARLP